jgi:chemotaxis protein histidine kinase CheA
MNGSVSGPPSRPPSPEVVAALKELQAEYARYLPGIVAKLAASLRRAKEHPEDAAALEQARMQAHKLRGSAGSYGFADVGDAAVRIEDAATSMQNAGPVSRYESWPELERAMAEMTAAAKRAIEGFEVVSEGSVSEEKRGE